MCSFKGSATVLCGLLKAKFGGEYFANRLTRDMFKHAYELCDLGVTFEPKRSNGQRLLLLHYDKNSDRSDGKMLMPEQPQTADPAVTPDDADCSETVENTDLEVNDVSTSADIFTDPVRETTVPADGAADPEYILIDGKRVPILRFSLDDLLNR
ncbi:MAG: hypothetical protein IJ555_09830, partial [Ruminococcus sp.]|nr:hypothetical protein [Ruminococcus sp.]